jgi:hypothetical protein
MPNTPDNWKTTARVTNPERAETWQRIFGTDRIPLVSFVPQRGDLPGIPDALFYMLDLKVITAEQRARLVEVTAERFKLDPAFVEANLDVIGVPVLADDVHVCSTDQGLFMSLVLDDILNDMADLGLLKEEKEEDWWDWQEEEWEEE